jgi:hypothetical protein
LWDGKQQQNGHAECLFGFVVYGDVAVPYGAVYGVRLLPSVPCTVVSNINASQ